MLLLPTLLLLLASPAQDRPVQHELELVDLAGTRLHDVELRYTLLEPSRGLQFAPLPFEVAPLLREQSFRPCDGTLTLTVPPGHDLVLEARRAEQWGCLWIPWRDFRANVAPKRLELAPDWDLALEVQDAAGQPVTDAVVRLQCEGPGSYGIGASPLPIVFAHLGYTLRHEQRPARVSVDGVFATPVEAEIDPRQRPRAPLVLRLPPTGSLELELSDPDDLPLAHTWTVELAGPTQRQHGYAREGRVLFPHVALGQALTVTFVGFPGAQPMSIDGPTWAGERIVRTLVTPRWPAAEASTSTVQASELTGPTGSFGGRLLLDPGLPVNALALELLDVRAGFTQRLSLHGSGEFAGDDVPAGLQRLEVRSHGLELVPARDRAPLFQVEFTLAPGANELPELARIDLRGKLFMHRVHFSEPPPPALEALVRFRPRSWPAGQRGHLRLDARSLVFVTPWPEVEAELFLPGYRSVQVSALGAERTLTLEPGLPVALQLSGASLPAAPFELAAVLVPAQEERRPSAWQVPAFQPGRPLETTACAPGTQRVLWILSRDGRKSSHETEPPLLVDVRELGTRQSITLELDPAQLARWVAEF